MHWSEDFLQVALCPVRVQSQQRGKKKCLFSHLRQKTLCISGKGFNMHSRVCTKLPGSLSLLQLPSPLLFATHPSV